MPRAPIPYPVGRLYNITFEGIRGTAGGPIVIAGSPERAISGLVLQSIDLEMLGVPRPGRLDLRPGPYDVQPLATTAPVMAQYVQVRKELAPLPAVS